MKKVTLIIVTALFTLIGYSQVFNTASTLKKGVFSLGIEPALHIDGGSDGLMLFAHGGFGIKSGIDFSAKIGIGDQNYIGADLEWKLAKNISLTTGAHNFGDFGLDGALLVNIPIKGDTKIFTGGDVDIVFANEINLPIWIPIGVEIAIKKKVSFILEAEIGVFDSAYHVIGGGLNFYL